MAPAFMPRSLRRFTYSFILLEPSKREYSVWTCRCVNDIVNLPQSDSEIITAEALYASGCIKDLNAPIKVLGTGEIKKAVQVKLNKFTKTAQAAIEKAGGKVEVI